MGRGQNDETITANGSASAYTKRVPADQEKLYKQASKIAKAVIRKEPKAKAVLIYGSVATGGVHADSDIDLMILSDEPISARQLKDKIPELSLPHLNVVYYTPDTVQKTFDREWAYIACLADTAQVIAGDPEYRKMIELPQPSLDVTYRQLQKMALELENIVLNIKDHEDDLMELVQN